VYLENEAPRTICFPEQALLPLSDSPSHPNNNPDLAAAGPATLEFALQGVLNTQTGASHSVGVYFNGVTIGSLDFATFATELQVTTAFLIRLS
jgi:hypothetical protein